MPNPNAVMPESFSILIVEDDDDARQNMEDILSLDGYPIQSESHCLTAIVAIEQKQFDAVVIDWRLPDANADQLIPIVIKTQPDTPVIVVTGMRDFETAVTALRIGAYDFLLKPINPDVLRSVLSRLVERKRHIQTIKEAQEKVLESERLAAIGQMVAGLAHESRNAFQRSHACLAELTLDLQEMPDSLQLVQKVQRALDDVNFLLDEVRDYSAPINLERRRCSLESLIKETWQHILDAGKVDSTRELNVVVSPTVPAECFIDPFRIQQVIRNLLENAIFAGQKDSPVRVSLATTADSPPRIRLEVVDDGEGVEDAQREKIFAPFFTTKTKGTGLGLALSRRLVQAHEGRIFVEAADSGGACFVVEIPSGQ